MMRAIQESEAKTCLPELLAAVEQGETVAITRAGRAVAHLAPAAEPTPAPSPYPAAPLPLPGTVGKGHPTSEPTTPAAQPQPTIAELRAETPAENYQRWLAARGPISESLQELLDWRREGLL